mmetsp:Transcript_94054/g.265619  ORF Transcript_94054/g.265619 Transcript_94054/m.265619 type:complete len:320 (-) Transcript_94054:94-1053(-)
MMESRDVSTSLALGFREHLLQRQRSAPGAPLPSCQSGRRSGSRQENPEISAELRRENSDGALDYDFRGECKTDGEALLKLEALLVDEVEWWSGHARAERDELLRCESEAEVERQSMVAQLQLAKAELFLLAQLTETSRNMNLKCGSKKTSCKAMTERFHSECKMSEANIVKLRSQLAESTHVSEASKRRSKLQASTFRDEVARELERRLGVLPRARLDQVQACIDCVVAAFAADPLLIIQGERMPEAGTHEETDVRCGCGQICPDGANFCSHCGRATGGASSTERLRMSGELSKFEGDSAGRTTTERLSVFLRDVVPMP